MNNQANTLLSDIENFIARHGMAESTFGRNAIGDWKLISTLRAGRDLRTSTVERIRAFMNSYVAEAA